MRVRRGQVPENRENESSGSAESANGIEDYLTISGQSTSTNTQNCTTAPWLAAQPALQGILGQIGTGLNNTGLTGQESGALNTGVANANANTAAYAPQIGAYATNLLNGGGANAQAGNVNQNYQNYQHAMQPLASNTN